MRWKNPQSRIRVHQKKTIIIWLTQLEKSANSYALYQNRLDQIFVAILHSYLISSRRIGRYGLFSNLDFQSFTFSIFTKLLPPVINGLIIVITLMNYKVLNNILSYLNTYIIKTNFHHLLYSLRIVFVMNRTYLSQYSCCG